MSDLQGRWFTWENLMSGPAEFRQTDCKEVMSCRVCGGPLAEVLDLGEQCLGGVFPATGEPDPPRFPLMLTRCTSGCGLVQLGHTVRPELMFGPDYGYRSGITETMRVHLKEIAEEAVALHGGKGPHRLHVLDIGGNDGTLLNWAWRAGCKTYCVDPSGLAQEGTGHLVLKGFFPDCIPSTGRFDLIFTIACFYDANDPVAFARAVRDNLADGGLWCVEVADLVSLLSGAWDGICHEHLCYYDRPSLTRIVNLAGLKYAGGSRNDCNGGSIRAYFSKGEEAVVPVRIDYPWENFKNRVLASATALRDYLHRCQEEGLRVHLLGASTKANTVLQYCGVVPELIFAASERDQKKIGRRTPGTGIPIISEEESRAQRPDVYLVGPWHFRDEIVAREKEFLDRGGRLAFALPTFEEVRR